MAQQPIEELLPKANYSVYRLVRMAANRALELADGKPPLIKNLGTDKLTSIALEEIYQGKIVTPEAAKVLEALQKEKKSQQTSDDDE